MSEFEIHKDEQLGYYLTRNVDGRRMKVNSMGQPDEKVCYYNNIKAARMSCERLNVNAGPVEDQDEHRTIFKKRI